MVNANPVLRLDIRLNMGALKILTPSYLPPAGREAGARFDAGNTKALEAELRRRVEGEVRFDRGSLAVYAVDGSNYRQVPIGVVCPKSVEDVIATVAACREFGAPLLSRGGGTSLAGQCCNHAIVMDWSKYLHKVLEVDPINKVARVQPGCVLDDLRNKATQHGLTFGPDPATHDHCTLGGMIGNNSCGVHAQMAGAVSNNVESLDILLYDGTRMTVGWMTERELDEKAAGRGREAEIYARLRELRNKYTKLIQERYPPIPRRISGYNLDQLIPDKDGRFNLARALVGSEGTLVTILEATLRLVHNPPFQSLLVLGYPDVYQAGDDVPTILEAKPMGFEGLDYFLIQNMKKKGMHVKDLDHLPEGRGWLMVQMPGETKEEADGKAHELMAKLKKRLKPPTMRLYDKPEDEKAVWEVRESGLGATAFVPGEPVTWEGWEDAAVPPQKVGDYLRDFCKLLEKFEYKTAMYGHFGMGCIHCRINFDFFTDEGVKKFRKFIESAADLVVSYGGSLSGEHGDGQSRGELLPKMFGPELVEAFREYKSIWDPDWKMNPGKIVDPYRLDENLRVPAWNPREVETHFKYPDDHGSFAHAALRCVGVGKCRREKSNLPEDSTMCPSYMVTREEKHSTRGRAHILWEMLHGDPVRDGWRDESVKEALDLCLSCKGCKGDCPVNVDMATYKAEFLSHYWEGRVRPRHAYAFGLVDKWAQVAAMAPGLVNLFTSMPGTREIAKLGAGMPMQRKIPQFAPQTFTRWMERRKNGTPQRAHRVILFPDTFNNYFFPQTARAATEVLEHLGFEVEVPPEYLCCGRPLYDYGFLDLAKQYLERVMRVLRPAIEQGVPIVVLEPSCWSVLRDEIKGLFPEREEAKRLTENTFLLGEFLDKHVDKEKLPKLKRAAKVHPHCHHKAIVKKAEHEQNVLKEMGVEAEMVASGCCGMAGSFGFEKDKYDVSVKVGEHMLLPKVRKAGMKEIIVADGFSCREQISQLTDRHGLHLAELMKMAIDSGPWGPEGTTPEMEILKPHFDAIRRSKWTAALGVAGVAAAGAGVYWAMKRR